MPIKPNTSMMGRTMSIPIYKALPCFVIGSTFVHPYIISILILNNNIHFLLFYKVGFCASVQ